MNFYTRGFNLYLLGLVISLTAACGCQSTGKKDDHLAMIRIHVENRAQLLGSGETVTVLRSHPVLVTINNEPFLTDANIVAAVLLETPGGVAVEIKLDEIGTYTLEQYTAAYAGKHLAIFGQWNEKVADSRWLAAPLINHRIADGVLAFTPDCSPEEAKQLVVGLNNMAKEVAKGKMK
jgi:preprotein translocase subunit SecD